MDLIKKEINDSLNENFWKYFSLITIGILTLVYSISEIIFGIKLNSLTLLSDGFHNLSDVIALIIAFFALLQSTKSSNENMTYGWKRTEILGAMMNAVFLVALCLYILLESIPRLIYPPEEPDNESFYFIIIASIGLLINLIGTIVFALTGHGHSHIGIEEGGGHSHSHSHDHNHHHHHDHIGVEDEHSHTDDNKEKSTTDYNFHAVFIHYLGDAISSLFVLISGLLIHFFHNHFWTHYIDTIVSIIIVFLIIITVYPLIKNCSIILLQTVPSKIDISKILKKFKKISEINEIHDLHIWQLNASLIISSIHIVIEESEIYKNRSILEKIKKIFHKFGIHSTTIQVEYNQKTENEINFNNICKQNCIEKCVNDWCCKKD